MTAPCPTCGRCEVTEDELYDIIIQVAMGHHDDISNADSDNAQEAADAILQRLRGKHE